MQLRIEAQCSNCRDGLLISEVFLESALGVLDLQVDPCSCGGFSCDECSTVDELESNLKDKNTTIEVLRGEIEELTRRLAQHEAIG